MLPAAEHLDHLLQAVDAVRLVLHADLKRGQQRFHCALRLLRSKTELPRHVLHGVAALRLHHHLDQIVHRVSSPAVGEG
jgi:hypothetical protein